MATAVVEAIKQVHLFAVGTFGKDGGHSMAEGRMMREVVELSSRELRSVVAAGCGGAFLDCAEVQGLFFDLETSVTEENRGCNSIVLRPSPLDRWRSFRRGKKCDAPEPWRGMEETLSAIFRNTPTPHPDMRPTRIKKLHEAMGVEKWEMNARRLMVDLKEKSSCGLRTGLSNKKPRDVAEHFSQNISDADQYENVTEMILKVC